MTTRPQRSIQFYFAHHKKQTTWKKNKKKQADSLLWFSYMQAQRNEQQSQWLKKSLENMISQFECICNKKIIRQLSTYMNNLANILDTSQWCSTKSRSNHATNTEWGVASRHNQNIANCKPIYLHSNWFYQTALPGKFWAIKLLQPFYWLYKTERKYTETSL